LIFDQLLNSLSINENSLVDINSVRTKTPYFQVCLSVGNKVEADEMLKFRSLLE